MIKINFLFNMSVSERSYDEKSRCCFWMKELKDDWKIKTICEQINRRNPTSIEFCRKSVAGENIISGELELQNESKQLLLQKKFLSLIENGSSCTRIDLKCPSDVAKPYPKHFLLTGEILISARTVESVCLKELLHFTKSDFSSLSQLSDDMEKLMLENSAFADANLKCGSVDIPINKTILSLRSPVFKAMFSCPLKETLNNEVIIKDIEPPIMQALVKYIYTGSVKDITQSLALDLIIAANKYQVEGLETACSNYLMAHLSMKNVLSVLIISDFISPITKNFAMDFICNKCTNYSALEKSKDWIILKNKMPTLALEIFSCIVKSQEEKLKSAHKLI